MGGGFSHGDPIWYSPASVPAGPLVPLEGPRPLWVRPPRMTPTTPPSLRIYGTRTPGPHPSLGSDPAVTEGSQKTQNPCPTKPSCYPNPIISLTPTNTPRPDRYLFACRGVWTTGFLASRGLDISFARFQRTPSGPLFWRGVPTVRLVNSPFVALRREGGGGTTGLRPQIGPG